MGLVELNLFHLSNVVSNTTDIKELRQICYLLISQIEDLIMFVKETENDK